MRRIDPAMPTYERFLLAAELLEIPAEELARRLDHSLPRVDSASSAAVERQAEKIGVHARYLGQRIEAQFDQFTNKVTITSGELAGSSYGSPSSAAIAVVEALNPERESANTNGRLFWLVNDTGKPLRSLLGRR